MDDLSRLGRGEPDGTVWRPPEVDVSLRPGWFFHAAEHPRPLAELLDIYQASVGHGCCLLLNLPPDRRGLIPEEDVARLRELRAALDARFADDKARARPATASNVRGNDPRFAAANLTDGRPDTCWAADDDVHQATIEVGLAAPAWIGCVRLDECIALGQRIEAFAVDVKLWSQWLEVATGTTIGARRLVTFPAVHTDAVRVRILATQACPVLRRLSAFAAPGR
ncbi:MAG: F5/8 type C domain protein [Lentisphaerae bacterium ADurb.BinA184]|nr:MAG: F5/8 type C domain protein [Lentisphaerae bacterium ADurb.BinA184]